MEMPERIYLQIETEAYVCGVEEITIEHLGDATWCVDRIHDTDVEYVRRDVAVKLRKVMVQFAATPRGRASVMWKKLFLETAWLADSPQPPVSPDGESGEEGGT